MSSRAEMYVRKVTRRPRGIAAGAVLRTPERMLFRELAKDFNEELGCAFGKVSRYAGACGWTPVHTRRVMASLEECGLILRRPMQSQQDGSQTTNEYDFPLMGIAADDEARQPMGLAAEEERQARRNAAGGYKFKRRPMPLHGAGSRPVQMKLECSGPPNHRCSGPPNHRCSPMEREEECVKKKEPHTLPLAAVDCAQSQPTAEVPLDACLVMGKARATASATANATTPKREDASGARDGVGDSARVRARDLPGLHELDGEDAALHAEVTRVQYALGVVGDALRLTLTAALKRHVEQAGCTIAQAGVLAQQRWEAYTCEEIKRPRHVPLRQFFREGMWLRPGMWPVDRAWQQRERQRAEASIGQHRVN